jgi:transcriptional pleiotropic regulator of transition state genes
VLIKPTGRVMKIDRVGRVSIPVDLRKKYDMAESDAVEFLESEEGLLIRKYKPGCIICGNIDCVHVFEVDGSSVKICNSCRRDILAGQLAEKSSR